MNMLRFRSHVMLLGLMILLLGTAIAASGPLLRISEREVDFGKVEQYQTVKHQITLGNEGDMPLRILKVESSCGCTVAVPSDSIVPPGRAVTLNIAFSSKDSSGPQEKRIVLRTNDPAEPTVTILVRSDIHVLVRLEEELVHFDPVKIGTTAHKRVRIAADKDSGLEIAKIEGGKKIIETTMTHEDTADEAVIWLDIKIRPDAPAGIFRETLSLMTTKPKPTRTKLTVAGTIFSYFAVPGEGRLRLTPIRVGETTDVSILITCDGSKPYKLLSVDTGVPYLKGEILPRNETSFDLKITLLSTAKDGMFQQPIKIMTSDPQQPSIRLVVQGVVRK
jgi:hypothetical protein